MSLKLIGDEIERITGYPPEDFVDAATRTLFSIVHPTTANGSSASCARCANT